MSFIVTMNFPPVSHVTRGNVTLLQMEDAVDPQLWQPQTVIVVVIFGLVCVFHLMAFLYTVCLQSYVNVGAHNFPHPVKDRNVLYGLVPPLFIDNKDSHEQEKAPIMIDM